MKKIKYILVTAVILSFFFITACSTTQSVPQDDVYYSTTSHNNVTDRATAAHPVSSSAEQHQKAKPAGNSGYQQGKVENISQPTGQTTSGAQYDVDYSARLKRFHQSNDTSLDYYDNYYADRTTQDTSHQNSTTSVANSPDITLNLGFGSPYFGSSWSFGFGYPYSNWSFGLGGYGWDYPYYGWGYPGYGWGYPYYAWGYRNYGWGYPGYGWGYPSYGWGYPGYGWDYGYYPPYYPDYGYRAGVYQPRMHRGGGSSVPHGTTGGSGIYVSPNSKSAGHSTSAVSRKRVPVNPEGRNGKMIKPNGNNSRPAGSMRFNSELAKKRLEEGHTQSKLNKPGGSAVRRNPYGNRSSQFGISESRNRAAEVYRRPPAYQREESMHPRFQKPKQYQSLESRSMRSSKEFYRSPASPANPGYRQTGVRTVRPQKQPVRRQNIYRPATTRNSVYRGNYRPRSGVKSYSTPSRSYSSPKIFRSPASRNSSISRPSNSFRAPTHISAPPVRINTGSSSGSGGGGNRRSSGSGGIRR